MRRGSATIMGLVLMVFLVIILGGLSPLVMGEMRHTMLEENDTVAQAAAEAGAKRALVSFSVASGADWSWLNRDCTLANQPNVTYRVSIRQRDAAEKFNAYAPSDPIPPGFYLIESSGRSGSGFSQSTHTVAMQVTRSGIAGEEYVTSKVWLKN